MSTAVKSNKKLNIDYNFVIKGGLVLGGLYFGYKIINSLFKAVGLAPNKEQIKKDVELYRSLVLNAFSHYNSERPEIKKELSSAIKAIKNLKIKFN